ncbi:MAG: choice-of-anchor L domain-containing protein [Candidatus Kapabacteria bacterium]|nr:choice-of-anchor L domain-containing protein [Candidatus Kapabacteria bacterium]
MKIDITSNNDLNKLVNDYFVGAGITIVSITSNSQKSDYPLIGGFTDAKSKVGIDKGLVLATGNVKRIVQPGAACNTTMSDSYNQKRLISTDLYSYSVPFLVDAGGDASILTIVFIPSTKDLSFSYVFASEEYPEYVGSQFNDIFVFLLSGNGIIGKKNIALIPNTNTNVAINNVNNGGSGCGILSSFIPPSYPNYFKDNNGVDDYVFDGQTKELTATVNNLTIGSQYTMDIIIQDIGDMEFDSGIFLKAGSFQSKKNYILDFTKEICENNTLHILADNSLTNVSWNGPNNFNSSNSEITILNAKKANEGMYYLTAKDNNLIIKDSCYMKVLSLPNIKINTKSDICFGESVNATASGGSDYKWYVNSVNPSNFISSNSNLNYSTTISQKYILVGNDGFCDNYDTTNVTINPLPVIDISSWQYGVCPNSTERYKTTESSSYTYDWIVTGGKIDSVSNGGQILNGGLNAKNAFSLKIKWGAGPIGKISLNVKDTQFGCTNQYSLDIPINGEMNPNIFGNGSPTIDSIGVCIGNPIILEARGSVGEYKWFKFVNGVSTILGTSSTFQPIENGTYISTITDNNSGCFGKDSIYVEFYPLPLANSGTYTTVCEGTPINLSGSGGNTYQWLDIQNNLLSTNQTFQISPISGTFQYILKAISKKGCIDLDTCKVVVNPIPNLNDLSKTYFICENNPLIIVLDPTSNYQWSKKNGAIISSSNTLSTVITSTSTFTVTATNSAGCQIIKDFEAIVSPVPIADAGADTAICKNAVITLFAKATNNIEWSDELGNIYPNDSTLKVKLVKSTKFKLKITNKIGCFSEDFKQVTVQPLAQADAGLDSLHICIGDEIELIGKGSGTLTWLDEKNQFITNSSQFKVKPNQTSKYYLTVYDNIGCDDIDSCVVVVHPYPISNAGNDLKLCFGESATLTGNDEYLKKWTEIGAGVISSSFSSVIVTPKKTTFYEYEISSLYGCTSRDTIQVVIVPIPQTKAPNDLLICQGETSLLKASGADTYEWFDQSNILLSTSESLSVTPISNQKYYLKGKIGPCSSIDSVNVNVKEINETIETKDNFFKSTDVNVKIPIFLNTEQNLLDCLKDSNEVKIEINYTLFYPISVEAENYTPLFSKVLNKLKNKWEITIIIPKSAKPNANKALFNLVGDVLLGNEDTTSIEITSLLWKNLKTKDSVINGRLILTNVCYENGKRLLNYLNNNQMQLSPNPADNEVSLFCELEDETESARIKVFDMLGNLVLDQNIITFAKKKQISSTFNLSKFANGVYNVTLQTDKNTITKILKVQK